MAQFFQLFSSQSFLLRSPCLYFFILTKPFFFMSRSIFFPILSMIPNQPLLSLVPRLSSSACLAPLSLTNRLASLVATLAVASPPPPFCFLLLLVVFFLRLGMVTSDPSLSRVFSSIVFVVVVDVFSPRCSSERVWRPRRWPLSPRLSSPVRVHPNPNHLLSVSFYSFVVVVSMA